MFRTTDRLLLREFAESDWVAVRAYQTDPRYLRFNPWTERSEDDARAFVQMFMEWQHETPRTRYQFAAVLPASGRLIGNCGIRVDGERRANIGYEFDPRYWGQGYGTESARARLAFGFGELHLHRIWANCVAENAASAHVLAKIGMRHEGTLHENEWMKGRWWDTALYAILDREWQAP